MIKCDKGSFNCSDDVTETMADFVIIMHAVRQFLIETCGEAIGTLKYYECLHLSEMTEDEIHNETKEIVRFKESL